MSPRILSGALALLFFASRPVLAEPAAIPYPSQQNQPDERGPLPANSDPTYVPPDQYPYEKEDRDEPLSHIDDPGLGLGAEFIAGALFVEATRGSLVDARFGLGARITWDWGRILPSEVLRQALFVDLQYLTTGFRDGTQQVFVDTRFHYLTIAPAYAFPFGEGSPYSFFLQLGAGVAILNAPLSVEGLVTPNSGTQSLLQYGLGIRGKPRIGGPESTLRLTFRVDVTRYHRGYGDDTYVGGAVGLAF
jgi:hypothetical protein